MDRRKEMEKVNDIYAIGINSYSINIWNRVFKSFRILLLILAIGFIITSIQKGYKFIFLIGFSGAAIFFLGYCFLINWKILFTIKFHTSSDKVELISIRGSRVKQEAIINRRDLKIMIRKNYGFRSPVWRIFFYADKKLIIKQNELNGWSNNMFLEIERRIKEGFNELEIPPGKVINKEVD